MTFRSKMWANEANIERKWTRHGLFKTEIGKMGPKSLSTQCKDVFLHHDAVLKTRKRKIFAMIQRQTNTSLLETCQSISVRYTVSCCFLFLTLTISTCLTFAVQVTVSLRLMFFVFHWFFMENYVSLKVSQSETRKKNKLSHHKI